MRKTKTSKTKLFFKILGNTIVIIILLSIALTVYSVFGPKEDFTTPIMGNYAIVKESSRSAYIVNTKGQNPEIPVVESIVISYATSGKFIAAKQTAVPETEDIKPDYTTYSYWLLNTADGQIYGPMFTEEEFNSQCQQLELSFAEWLGT